MDIFSDMIQEEEEERDRVTSSKANAGGTPPATSELDTRENNGNAGSSSNSSNTLSSATVSFPRNALAKRGSKQHELPPDTTSSVRQNRLASFSQPRKLSKNVGGSDGSSPLLTRRMSISKLNIDTLRKFSTMRRGSFLFGGPLTKPAGNHRTSAQAVTAEPKEEDEEDKLPRSPRFGATLSPEAQFASLKGYEDILVNTIANSYPEYSPLLCRAVTPPRNARLKKIKSIQPASEGQKSPRMEGRKKKEIYSFESDSDSDAQGDDSGSGSTKVGISPWLATRQIRPYPIKPSKSLKSMPALSRSKSMIPQSKRLMLSYRFQNAMDMLDNIKEKNGQIVTTQISKRRQFHPIQGYNSWSQKWEKEFQMKEMSEYLPKIPRFK